MAKNRTKHFGVPSAETGRRMPLTPGSTNMRTLAREALVEARVTHPDRWIVDAGAGDGGAEWDQDRVLQLLANLLAHALESTSEHTPVSFSWWGEPDRIVVEVECDPNRPGRDPGWTLGLSVAREIARGHGGRFTVSDTDRTRILRATLPRAVPASPGRPTSSAGARPVTSDGAA